MSSNTKSSVLGQPSVLLCQDWSGVPSHWCRCPWTWNWAPFPPSPDLEWSPECLHLLNNVTSFDLEVFKQRWLVEHQADSRSTSTLYAISSPPAMSPTTVVYQQVLWWYRLGGWGYNRGCRVGGLAQSLGVCVQCRGQVGSYSHSLGEICQEVHDPVADVLGKTQVLQFSHQSARNDGVKSWADVQ